MEKVYRTDLLLCCCTMCVSVGALRVRDALEGELKKHKLDEEIRIVPVGTSWLCTRGPTLIVQPDGVVYQNLKPEDIPFLVVEHLLKGRPVRSLMYVHPLERAPVPKLHDIPFYAKQRLIALWNRGLIDPEKIEEYIARDGYRSLANVLRYMTPEGVIEEIKRSGLRGRGGAGFPTGIKWELCRKNPGQRKYIICNADEGDPGAFMDRSIIEADPHAILEGMLIGAYAIGASKGYVYVRTEYPLAIKHMAIAIAQAEEYGILGDDMFGSGFSCRVEIREGSGAFVCGEETSLIHSIEGKIPEPRPRPPFPVQIGIWGCPTVINNVETLATVPRILDRGGQWFASIGTDKSKGTKVFSVAGDVVSAGLVEIPMGMTLREIIYDICGGIPKEKRFKAVQIGGPAGGFLPGSLLDMPVDYESLQETGTIMGSGGMVVLSEERCVVDTARFFADFLRDESCGKCSTCREGMQAVYEILAGICDGEGSPGDVGLLEELCEVIKDASQCGLGQSAPKSVLTSLRYFRGEYEAHIRQKRCPAVVCRGIISSPCQFLCRLRT
ncbi:MAG: NADH-ubiquinone oxidoreductase-F iron-sulfur binding region domain-containing protein [Bacteroidota bacterium]